MRMHRKLILALVGLALLLTCFDAVARLPMYFYTVGNWYSSGGWNYQQNAASLLAHQYADPYSAVAGGWNAHVPACSNGGGPLYILETVEPVASGGYAPGDLYNVYYKDLSDATCGEPSISHAYYGDGVQLYASCGGLDVTEHNANGPDDCFNRPVNAEKNRGTPPADCACSGGSESSNPAASDPVNPGSGNKFDILPLYRGSGPFPLDLTLSFNSMTGVSEALDRPHQIFGRQRVISYMRRIGVTKHNSDASAYVLRADGKTFTFNKVGSDWVGDSDVPDKLVPTYDPLGAVTAWTYLVGNGDIERYDVAGNLLSIQRQGWLQTLSYDASGRLSQVTDPTGRSLTFAYNPLGFVDTIQTPDGSVSFTYDASENVSRVTWPGGTHRDYLYAEPSFGSSLLSHNLTGVIDENGIRIDNTTYDDSEHVLSDFGPAGTGTTTITYGSSSDGNAQTTITHPLGSTEQVDYVSLFGVPHAIKRVVSCAGCTTQTTRYTFDANGRMASRTEPNGSLTLTTYDSSGLLQSLVEASGTAIQRTTTRTWDAALRKPLTTTVKSANGTVVRVHSAVYNAQGQVVAQCEIDPAMAGSYACAATGTVPAGVRRTVTTYCAAAGADCPFAGFPVMVDGPRTDLSDVATYRWYTQSDTSGCGAVGGACHHLGDLASVASATGLVTTYLTYDQTGRPTRIRSPDGTLTDMTYTPRGWLATKTVRGSNDGSQSAADATTTIGYTPDGMVHQVTDPDGVVMTYTYDAAHRLTDITDGVGNRIHYTLDAVGSRTKEEVIAAAGGVVKSTSQAFNALGQLTAITDGLGRPVFSATDADAYDGSGNLIHTRDGLGIQQKQVFDGLNHLISTIQNYQGADPATANTQSVTSYDTLDRMVGFSDPGGLNTTYDVDGLGNTFGTHSPDTGLTVRTFDAAGNALTSSDALHNTRTMTYDADNRPLTVSFVDSSQNIQYKYDEPEAVTGCTDSHAAGHRTRIVEAGGGMTWCYDGHGNVVKKIQTIGGVSRVTTYAWTKGDRLKSMTTPNGTTLVYARDTLGQTIGVSAAAKGAPVVLVVSQATYQPFGPVASVTWGNGLTATYTYDQTGALTDITGGAFTQHLRRDVSGNIVALGDSAGVPVATETYGYDPLYRLTSVNAPSGSAIEAYTYNQTGDRLSKVAPGMLTGSYTYAPGTHHLTGVGTTTRVVDARGNTTANALASGSYVYGYNDRNRMTSVQKDGATQATYSLNALGLRVQKTVGGQATLFDYNEDSQLISEASGSNLRDYVWLDGMPVGVVDSNGASSSVAFVAADGLGTPRAVTNSAGSVIWQWAFAGNPFGEAAPTSAVGYSLNLRFPGQYFDADNGLNYNVNRDYDPVTGRYIQSDPLGVTAGPSIYTYAESDPLTLVDALGLCACPGGKWTQEMLDFAFSGAVGGMLAISKAKMHCDSRPDLVVTILQTSIAGGPILGLGGSFSMAAKSLGVFDSGDFEGWSTNQCFLSVGPTSWSAPCGPPGGGYLGVGPSIGAGFAWGSTYTHIQKDTCPDCEK
jgi:RHS repeat-associated protein